MIKGTTLHLLNWYLFQYLFIRICRFENKVITSFQLDGISLMPNGSLAPAGKPVHRIETYYAIAGFIRPLSGYDRRPYKYFTPSGKPFYLRISKKKIV